MGGIIGGGGGGGGGGGAKGTLTPLSQIIGGAAPPPSSWAYVLERYARQCYILNFNHLSQMVQKKKIL